MGYHGIRDCTAGVLVLIALVGCLPKDTINTLTLYRHTGEREWQIDNPQGAWDVRVLDVREIQEGDILYVNLLIENSWHRPKHTKVKVEFFDRRGIQLDNPWGWRPVVMEAHQQEWFKFMAPKAEEEISKIKVMLRGIGDVASP
jgi:hypothetical protein